MGLINLFRKAGTERGEGSFVSPADAVKSVEDAVTASPAAPFRRRYAGGAGKESIPEMAGQKHIPF